MVFKLVMAASRTWRRSSKRIQILRGEPVSSQALMVQSFPTAGGIELETVGQALGDQSEDLLD
jgi:hypothetical protein